MLYFLEVVSEVTNKCLLAKFCQFLGDFTKASGSEGKIQSLRFSDDLKLCSKQTKLHKVIHLHRSFQNLLRFENVCVYKGEEELAPPYFPIPVCCNSDLKR